MGRVDPWVGLGWVQYSKSTACGRRGPIIIGTVRICEAESMKRYESVRPSIPERGHTTTNRLLEVCCCGPDEQAMSIDCCSSGERCVPEIIGTAQQYMQVTAARACLVRGSVGSSQSCPWVGLGWVSWVEIFSFWWVDLGRVHYSKSTKKLKGLC